MLALSVEADQVSHFLTGTLGGSCKVRYDFGMRAAEKLRKQHLFSSMILFGII